MKKPNGAMLFGHPAVAGSSILATFGALCGCAQNFSLWPIALGIGFLTHLTLQANLQRTKYLVWKREWDSMAAPVAPRAATRPPANRKWLGIAMLAMLGLFFAANASDPVYAMALAWLLVTATIAGIAALVLRKPGTGKRPKAPRAATVAICIQKPLLSAPRMVDAYRALPPHCQALFAAQERQRRATAG